MATAKQQRWSQYFESESRLFCGVPFRFTLDVLALFIVGYVATSIVCMAMTTGLNGTGIRLGNFLYLGRLATVAQTHQFNYKPFGLPPSNLTSTSPKLTRLSDTGNHLQADTSSPVTPTTSTMKHTVPQLMKKSTTTTATSSTPEVISNATAAKPRRTRIAILIPYRNRLKQMQIFIPLMISFLSKQNIDFRIFIADQIGMAKFNRASLLNVAFLEAFRNHTADYYDCVVIHDIDLLPIIAENSYDCNKERSQGAVQLSSAIDKYGWKLPSMAAGGVNMIRSNVVVQANGFSNRFFGWGGEDNDFDERMKSIGIHMTRRDVRLGRYKSISVGHYVSPGKAEDRFDLLKYTMPLLRHGEGLKTMQYRVVKRSVHDSHVMISVELWAFEDPDILEVLRHPTRG